VPGGGGAPELASGGVADTSPLDVRGMGRATPVPPHACLGRAQPAAHHRQLDFQHFWPWGVVVLASTTGMVSEDLVIRYALGTGQVYTACVLAYPRRR
jgi:hypothetical protein